MFPLLRILLPRLSMGAEIPIRTAVPHTEDAEEKGRRVVSGVRGLPTVYSSHHDNTSGATESRDAATEAANPSSQRQDPSAGMSTPPGQALGKWHRKWKYVSAVWSHHQRQGRDHRNQQVDPEETGDRRGKRHFSWTVEGRTQLDLVQDEVDEAKRLLEEAHVEVQAAQKKVPDHETVGGELGASWSMKTGQKKRLLGGVKKTKTMWEKWYETIKEEEKLQSNKDITVQCIDFCVVTTSKVRAVLQHAPPDMRGGTFPQHPRVLLATVGYQEKVKPTPSLTDTPCCHVPGLLRCIFTTQSTGCHGESGGTGTS